jgi:hypothetical protein
MKKKEVWIRPLNPLVLSVLRALQTSQSYVTGRFGKGLGEPGAHNNGVVKL